MTQNFDMILIDWILVSKSISWIEKFGFSDKITTKGWIEIFYETYIPILWKFYLFMIDVHIEKLYWYI